MKINWKVRFKNPVWLTSFCTFCVSTIYNGMSMFDIVPSVTEDAILAAIASVMQVLTLAGILVDPTTAGISDSETAMTYQKPKE